MYNLTIFVSDSESLTPSQIGMLAAVCNGEYRFNAKAVVERYALGNPQTITRNKHRLRELDIVEEKDNSYVFVDAVYELWFRQQYRRRLN